MDLKEGSYAQACFDAECRGYRSQAMPLDPAVLAQAVARRRLQSQEGKGGGSSESLLEEKEGKFEKSDLSASMYKRSFIH